MKAYKSNDLFYAYFVLVSIPSLAAFIYLLTKKSIELPLLICGEIVFAVIIALSVVATVSHLLLPLIVLEMDDESITLYKRRTKTAYKLCEITKVKIWMNNTLTLKFNMAVSGKTVNVEYHVKDIKSTRTLLLVMMKTHGIEVEEYIEEVVIGD